MALPWTVFAADPPPVYLDELVRTAAARRLADARMWQRLLHYRRAPFGVVSRADGPGFFLAPHGRTDPAAELAATLAAFFSTEPVGTARQPAQCAFPARYRWLKTELGFDAARLPDQDCPRLAAWRAALDPESVTLVFPSSFMNNPSSMFGHTLLRIDQRGQTERTRLLAYAVNFAAQVTTDNGFAYAVRGITGGFPGYFSIYPYYVKVQEYSEIENRDIWEYRLTLTPDQIELLLLHTWELGNTYFDYYFFTENCSYHLLALLEVADPSLSLTDRMRSWTIPADTVRWVAERPGLVAEVIYRPSRATVLRSGYQALAPAERAWFDRLRSGATALDEPAFAALPPERQARLLDLAADELLYRAKLGGDPAELRRRQRNVLERRSRLRLATEPAAVAPPDTAPERGHRTARLGAGAGWRAREPFTEITLRPAYHDLVDAVVGYPPDAQIEVLPLRLRRYAHSGRVRLDRLALADVVSLAPFDPLFRPISWKISGAYEAVRHAGCDDCGTFVLNGGAGAAIALQMAGRHLFYLLPELDLRAGHAYAPGYRAGVGATAGVLLEPIAGLRTHLRAGYISYPLGDRGRELRAGITQGVPLARDLALRLELDHADRRNEAVVTLNGYF